MIYLGLGSNLGNRKANLRLAIRELVFGPVKLKRARVSHVYESDALLPEGAPSSWTLPFFNIALCGETNLSREELFKECKKIERSLGRQPGERWSPRTIDIDILGIDQMFAEFQSSGQTVTIPHKEVLNRSFTLAPLAEIAPNWTPPIPDESRTIAEIFKQKQSSLSFIRKKEFSIFPVGLMGIVNVTPDSFSDGNEAFQCDDALTRINQLIENGVDILDIGAESTRPGAETLSADAEWSRLEPIIQNLTRRQDVQISIDSRKPKTIRRSFDHPVDWINDVTGLEQPEMIDAAIDSKRDVVFMHHLGVPPNRSVHIPKDQDPIVTLKRWATEKIQHFQSAGLNKSQLIFDPGVGFGKTAEQSLEICERAGEFRDLGVRILVGHSRKSFLSLFTDQPFSNRDIETLAISEKLMNLGIDYIRIHNVQMHQRFFRSTGFGA